MCDFETTVYDGQINTEVWASACVELFTEDVKIFHSIDDTFKYFISLNTNLICYYHNLKFDGNFWLSYLLDNMRYEQAYTTPDGDISEAIWIDSNRMRNKTFKYTISDLGQWYSIIIKVNDFFIEIRDSLKLLPFSVKELGKSFDTKHRKLEMEYKGFRYAGCNITEEEKEYIANDVLVVKEALETMFNEGNNRLTIGSCCLSQFRRLLGKELYDTYFPDLSIIKLDEDIYGEDNVDRYIRNSYKGGWCYVVKGKEGKKYHKGVTVDVNSLYPSMMHSESGNRYPVGLPKFWTGNYIPEEALMPNKYYFIRIRTSFNLKRNKLPFIQIKNDIHYVGTEMLETSDFVIDGKRKKLYKGADGIIKQARATLTLTKTDYELFLEHYSTSEFEVLDGCYFATRIGIFDEYIDKYKQIKMTSKGAKRTLAKLFLNNLYGKMASSTQNNFKIAFLKEDLSVGFIDVDDNSKKAGYIAVGSAITSYARNFTIRAAQMNFHGRDKDGFIYADTDSIHCNINADELKGVTIDAVKFCCWKVESTWDLGLFVRQKTYIEHIIEEDQKPIENSYYNIKCAGMPESCKDLFMKSMQGYKLTDEDREKYDEEKIKFIETPRTVDDFKVGLCIPGKLIPKRITGGVLLVETNYEIR